MFASIRKLFTVSLNRRPCPHRIKLAEWMLTDMLATTTIGKGIDSGRYTSRNVDDVFAR